MRCGSGTGWSGIDWARAGLRHDDTADGNSRLGCWCGFRNNCGWGFGCCCGWSRRLGSGRRGGDWSSRCGWRLWRLDRRRGGDGGLRCGRRRGCRRSSYYCGAFMNDRVGSGWCTNRRTRDDRADRGLAGNCRSLRRRDDIRALTRQRNDAAGCWCCRRCGS